MAQSYTTNYSDIFLGKVAASDLGYNYEQATVTFAAGMTAGTALKLVAGKYVAATAADDTDIVAVLADVDAMPNRLIASPIAAGDHTMVVGVRGLTVNANYLVYANGNKVSAAGQAALSKATFSKIQLGTTGNQPA